MIVEVIQSPIIRKAYLRVSISQQAYPAAAIHHNSEQAVIKCRFTPRAKIDK
jgi:hypothetical protein